MYANIHLIMSVHGDHWMWLAVVFVLVNKTAFEKKYIPMREMWNQNWPGFSKSWTFYFLGLSMDILSISICTGDQKAKLMLVIYNCCIDFICVVYLGGN